jgi:hypothetical protein
LVYTSLSDSVVFLYQKVPRYFYHKYNIVD